jgi:hypothetical protein
VGVWNTTDDVALPVDCPDWIVKLPPAMFVPPDNVEPEDIFKVLPAVPDDVDATAILLSAPFVNVTLPPNDDVVPTVNVVPEDKLVEAATAPVIAAPAESNNNLVSKV